MRSSPLLLALVVAASATRISVHSERGCASESLIATFDVNSTFLNLCDLQVASVIVPPGVSVAVFEQCRTDTSVADPNPNFKHFLEASVESECVNFVTLDGRPVKKVTIGLMPAMADVCHEYALHAHLYCKRGECRPECQVALNAAEDFASNCVGVDETALANLRYAQQEESSSSESESNSGSESESESSQPEDQDGAPQDAPVRRPHRRHGQQGSQQQDQEQQQQGQQQQQQGQQGQQQQQQGQHDQQQRRPHGRHHRQQQQQQEQQQQQDQQQQQQNQNNANQTQDAPSTGRFKHMCYKGLIQKIRRCADSACSFAHVVFWGLLALGTALGLSFLGCATCCLCRGRHRTIIIGASRTRSTTAIPVAMSAPHLDKEGRLLLETIAPANIEVVALQPSHIVAQPTLD